jgi:hypothetical protein
MKAVLKHYQSDEEHNFGDKALLPLYDGWTIVEIRAKDGRGWWIFLNEPYGTSTQPFSKYLRPFDEEGNLLPIELWKKVCDELNAKRQELICYI